MTARAPKAVILYLALVLALTAGILFVFAFLSPTMMLHDRVALLTISPSTTLTQPGLGQKVDGSSVFLGPLGQCTRTFTEGGTDLNCKRKSFSPRYALDALPPNTPRSLVYAPSGSTPMFILIALVLDGVFLITYIVISIRHKLGWAGSVFESSRLQSASAGIGVLGFITGLSGFLILRTWFGKIAQDFNSNIQAQGSQGPKVIAKLGIAFPMVWAAHAFWAVPVILALAKSNATVSVNKGKPSVASA